MALAFKITKAQYNKLSEELQGEYLPTGDGKAYELDVTDLPELDADTTKLRNANARLKEDKDTLTEELKETKAELAEITSNQSAGEKDVLKVTKRFEGKIKEITSAADAKHQKLRDSYAKKEIAAVAMGLGTKLSKAPELFADAASKLMTVVWDDDDNPTVKYFGDDGKTVDDKLDLAGVEKKLLADPKLSAILIGTRASGGGASTTTVPLNPGGASQQEKSSDLSKASNSDLLAHVKAKVAERGGV